MAGRHRARFGRRLFKVNAVGLPKRQSYIMNKAKDKQAENNLCTSRRGPHCRLQVVGMVEDTCTRSRNITRFSMNGRSTNVFSSRGCRRPKVIGTLDGSRTPTFNFTLVATSRTASLARSASFKLSGVTAFSCFIDNFSISTLRHQRMQGRRA